MHARPRGKLETELDAKMVNEVQKASARTRRRTQGDAAPAPGKPA